MLRLPEEATTTPVQLFKISFFAAFAFLLMAAMLDAGARNVPLVIGALILVLLGITAAWLAWQRRYGDAVLTAKTELIGGQLFEGVIETGLTRVPSSPVRILLYGWYEGTRIDVAPQQMRLTESGLVHIPFSFLVPRDELGRPIGRVRLYVRTRTWPVGWGATFLLIPS